MDEVFSYQISVNGLALQTDPGITGQTDHQSDILLTNPNFLKFHYKRMLKGIRPRVIIPIHWDNFFLPINRNGRNKAIESLRPFPLHKLRMTRFIKIVQRIDPMVRLVIPEFNQPYQLEDLLGTKVIILRQMIRDLMQPFSGEFPAHPGSLPPL